MWSVLKRKGVLHSYNALGSGRSCEINILLDRHRDSVKGAKANPFRESVIRLVGSPQRLLCQHHRHCIDLRVHRLDAVEMGLYNIVARDRLLSDRPNKIPNT
jgi:hypothetical protein